MLNLYWNKQGFIYREINQETKQTTDGEHSLPWKKKPTTQNGSVGERWIVFHLHLFLFFYSAHAYNTNTSNMPADVY